MVAADIGILYPEKFTSGLCIILFIHSYSVGLMHRYGSENILYPILLGSAE